MTSSSKLSRVGTELHASYQLCLQKLLHAGVKKVTIYIVLKYE